MYYFSTERGRLGYSENRCEFKKLIWQIASPKWDFDDGTFERTAASFANPDHVDIVIHNYRWRLSLAEGEPQYGDLEARLFERPVITVPTVTIGSDFDRGRRGRTCLCGEVLGRVLASSPRRHRTQCAPRSPGRVHRRHPRSRTWTAVSFFSRLRRGSSMIITLLAPRPLGTPCS